MVALLCIVGFIGLLALAWWDDSRRDRKQAEKWEAEKAAWLAAENAKPLMKLEVVLRDGRHLLSEPFEPSAWISHGWISGVHKTTSLEHAENAAEKIIKSGRYFHAQRKEYVPLSEIKTTLIVEKGTAK